MSYAKMNKADLIKAVEGAEMRSMAFAAQVKQRDAFIGKVANIVNELDKETDDSGKPPRKGLRKIFAWVLGRDWKKIIQLIVELIKLFKTKPSTGINVGPVVIDIKDPK